MISRNRGLLAAMVAFTLWGVLPVYWKLLHHFSPLEIVSHRITWSTFALLILLFVRDRWASLTQALRSYREVRRHLLTGLLLLANWLIYIWATLNGRIMEASLGYFITPLFNVLLGSLVLKECTSTRLKCAIGLATLGVLVQMAPLVGLPWVALGLAGTFGWYGLIKKQSPLGPVTGLALETALLVPLAAAYLVWIHGQGTAGISTASGLDRTTLAMTGLVTSVPLLLFATAARALPLHTLGLLQYLAPSLQFLIGWLLYQEPLDGLRLASFGLIWLALAIYAREMTGRRS